MKRIVDVKFFKDFVAFIYSDGSFTTLVKGVHF